jgi:hypothetical protein
MAADSKKEMIEATAISADGITLGKTMILPSDAKNLMLVETISSRTDRTYVGKLQFSHDGGVTWMDIKEADDSTVWDISAAADGSSYTLLLSTVPFGTLVRGVITASAVTAGATAKLELLFGRNR